MEGIIDITMTNSMNIVAYCRHDYHYLQGILLFVENMITL